MDSDRVKSGEVVDFDLMNLTENFGEGANAMRMSAEHKVRGGGIREKEDDEMSLSEEEEMRERKRLPDRMGMSKGLSTYLAKLPASEREKMRREKDSTFEGGGRRRGKKLEIARHKEGESHTYPAENADALRKDILGMSLFPNLYNKKNLLMSM